MESRKLSGKEVATNNMSADFHSVFSRVEEWLNHDTVFIALRGFAKTPQMADSLNVLMDQVATFQRGGANFVEWTKEEEDAGRPFLVGIRFFAAPHWGFDCVIKETSAAAALAEGLTAKKMTSDFNNGTNTLPPRCHMSKAFMIINGMLRAGMINCEKFGITSVGVLYDSPAETFCKIHNAVVPR